MNSRVTICVETGPHYERHVISIPVSESMLRELEERVELSDKPFSLMLVSPGMCGGKGDAVDIRRRVFKMREQFCKEIADTLVTALVEHFGRNDVTDRYTKKQLEAMSR